MRATVLLCIRVLATLMLLLRVVTSTDSTLLALLEVWRLLTTCRMMVLSCREVMSVCCCLWAGTCSTVGFRTRCEFRLLRILPSVLLILVVLLARLALNRAWLMIVRARVFTLAVTLMLALGC